MKAKLVGIADKPIDIAVLALDRQLAPEMPLSLGSDGIQVSGKYFFLGFPFDISLNSGLANNGYPFPLVKSALCSGFIADDTHQMHGFYLDGINNPGFSGGPVVSGETSSPRVFAVISGYRYSMEPVVDAAGVSVAGHFHRVNTGIILAYDIRFALKEIGKNPIGVQLP